MSTGIGVDHNDSPAYQQQLEYGWIISELCLAMDRPSKCRRVHRSIFAVASQSGCALRSKSWFGFDAVRVEGGWEGWLDFFVDGVATIADEAIDVKLL